MFKIVKKRYFIPSILSIFLLIGVSFKDDFFEISKQIEIFTTLFKTINQNYVDDTNPAELMDKAIKSMLADLDPYTNYFNEQDVIKFKINNTGEYTGIGAMITRKEDKLIIKEPYKGFPADKAGLKAGDEITQIGDVLLVDFKDDASQLMKGAKGTKININYLRQGKPMSTQLILDEVAVKAVPFYGMVDDKTGYIVLSQFNQKASYETKEALEKLKDDGATQIVLDLRGNPGGLLNEAVTICNLFVPKNEIIVTTKSKNSKYNNTYKTNKDPIDTEIPLVVIVDGKSASASEIVAGALQDHKRAVIMGTQSFGKGSVQTVRPLSADSALKLTTAYYYTPTGKSIQAFGIKPDIPVDQNPDGDPDDVLITREIDSEKHLRNKQSSEEKLINDREKRRIEELQRIEDLNAKKTPEEKEKDRKKRPAEFGTAEDFMLQQASAYLKGQTVKRSKSRLE